MIRDTVSLSEPVRPSALGAAVYARFKAEPDTLLIAVVEENGAPVGLLERNGFILKMASEYGRALYGARPVSLVMDADPVVVDADRDLAEFTAAMLSDRPSDLMRGFIVAEGGRYAGVGTALDLLRASNAANRRHAAELGALADSLAQANMAAEREKLFSSGIVENMPAMLFVKDAVEHRFVLVNRAVETALGWPREQMVGRRPAELFAPDDCAAYEAQDQAALHSQAVVEIDEERLQGRDGRTRLVRTRKLAVPDEAGAPRYIVAVSEDITERKAAQAQIERMAHVDALTDLANRTVLHRELDAALDAAGAAEREVAVICIDLDHFKAVNDGLGHAAGDTLLRQVAERLRACAGPGDVVARLGGDEFVVVQAQGGGRAEAERLARCVVDAVSHPFAVAGREVTVGASVGVALHPRDGDDGGELLKKADLALYRAKSEGRGGFRVFEPAMDETLRARRELEGRLREAIGAGELRLHFQPLFALGGAQVVGYEALLRWPQADGGWISPADFIPAAEDTGLIGPLGEWVLRAACAEAARWPAPLTLAVNVSPVQFRGGGLVGSVVAALAASGLAPDRLELEITENVLLGAEAANLRTLRQLRDLGCRVALDDFGTGYSSLSYLRAFPFDKVKIDRSFVRDLPYDRHAAAIVRAVADLARNLGMRTTAEGVETPEQLEALRRLGCDEVQGFLIGRPAPPETLPHVEAPAEPPAELPETLRLRATG